jgi:hypothetical protein
MPRAKTCRGKTRFRDRDEAVRSIRAIAHHGRHQGRDGKRPTRAYLCPVCKGWHLTSQDPRRS